MKYSWDSFIDDRHLELNFFQCNGGDNKEETIIIVGQMLGNIEINEYAYITYKLVLFETTVFLEGLLDYERFLMKVIYVH